MKIQFAAPCLFGLESFVADELRNMGAEAVASENGRVFLFFSKEINPRFYRGNKNALVKKNRASKGKPEKGVEEKKTSK